MFRNIRRHTSWLKNVRSNESRTSLLHLEQLEARENPAPIAAVSGLSNATPFLGDTVNYSFTFANTDPTDTGFSPFFDLVVETSGPDGTTNLPPSSLNPTNPANAADGFVGLSGATVPNVVVSGLALTPVGTPIVLTAGQTTYTNPFTNQTLSVPAGYGAGDTIYTYQLPFGSFTPGQNTQVSVQLPTSRLADTGTPLDLTVRPGFRDTDGNPNAPLVPTPAGTHLDASATATPKLYELIKTYVGPENETATGPNYVRRYRLSVDIATGQTINGLALTDDLGATMQLAGINGTNMAAFLASSGLGNNVFSSANLSGTATATAPDGTVVYSFGNVTGVAGVDAVFEFDFFVPRDNSAGNEILPQPTDPAPNPTGGTNSTTDTNTARSAGTWNPLDSRDPQNQNVAKAAPDNGPHTLEEHSVAVQKTVDIVTVANPNAPTGGSVVPGQSLLRYTINFQVSDYYAINDLFLEDVLGDGQRLYLAGGLTPTLTVQNPYTFANGGERAATSTGAFGGANTIDFERRYTIRNTNLSDPTNGVEGYAAAGPTGGPFSAATTGTIDGSTFLRFNISDELIARGLPGVLVGGEIADGGGDPQNARNAPFGPAQGTIVFWAIAKNEYSDDFPSGDRSVDQGDSLENSVPLIQGSHLDTNDLADGAPTQLGTVGTDTSGTSVTIANGVQTKTVFAINGTTIPTQTVADTVFSVQAGDRITYKLTYTLPISSFEDLVLIDIPPLPVMQVGPAGQYTFDRTNDNSFNPYEIEVAPDDTFFSTFGAFPTPTITTDPLANALRLDFGDFEDVQARATTISLLVTFPVGGDSFVGDLFLTNQLRVNEGNTFLGTTTVEDLRRIQLVRPIVTIDKGIVGFGDTGRALGGIQFAAPNDPPTGASTPSFTGTVDTAAEADAIGGANIAASDGADAGDRVRYAIVAQNTGRGDAYDVVIEDQVQPGYDIPATFAGLNLNVRRGDGTLLTNFAEVDAFARVATIGALTGTGISFSTSGGGEFTNADRALDGIVLNTNDLVLVKNQATASQNGVYRVTAVDAAANTVTLTRDAAFDTAGELSNSFVAIMGGTSANRYFQAGAVATLNSSAVNYTLQAATQDYYAIYSPVTGAFRLLLSDNYTAGNVSNPGEVPDDRAGSLSRRESTPLVNAGDNPPVTLVTNGSNTVVVQYDLILSSNVTPNQNIVNTAAVTNLGTSEGGENTTDPNLVTGATPITDIATAIVQLPQQTKTLIGTEVTEPGNAALNQATIGELVTYEVVLTIPEGVTPAANLFDQLDEGLAFVDILSVDFSSTALSTSNGLTFANNGTANATTLSANTTFSGSNNKNVTFALGDITNTNLANGTDETITIRYRAVALNTNAVPGDADGNQAGDTRNNSATLRWTNNTNTLTAVSAADVTIVEPQLTTTKDVAVQPAGTGAYAAFGQTVRADAGDNIRYQITIANGAPTGSTTAFDVTLSDQLTTANFSGGATAFSVFSVTTTGTGTVRRDGAARTLDATDFEITAGGVLRLNQAFRYDIEPNVSVVIVVEGLNFRGATGQLVDNVADVRWSSLEQDPGNRAGNGATNGVQRTGADGEGNGLNDYADLDNAVIESPPIVRKTLVSTSEASTSSTNTAVGEIARFRLVASIPEGTTRNFQIQDALPTGLAFLNDGTARFAFISTGGNVLSSAGITNVSGLGTPTAGTGGIDGNEGALASLLSANVIGTFNDDNVAPGSTGAGTGEGTVYANGADVFFRFGDLSNTDNDTDFEYVVIEFNALVLNVIDNQAGTALANRMTVLADTDGNGSAGYIDVVNDDNGDGTGAGEATIAANDPNNDATGTPALSAPLTLTVVEPAVTVTKSVVSPSPAAGDPGDTITFEITFANATGTNSSTAFDVVLTDTVPSDFENVTFVAGSLTSSGTVTGLPTSPTFSGNSISLALDSVAPGGSVTFRFTATINDNGASAPAPGSTITNTASATYTSLPGASGTGGAWTGTAATSSTVPGAAGAETGERTGTDGEGGALNDYADSDPADVTLNSHQVGGLLYHDADNDGTRDAGEALITDSTTFRLTGTDVAGNAVSVDVTTTTGAYNFTGLRAGTYTITQLDQPTGFLDGRDTAGTSSPGAQFGGTGTGATDDRGTPTTPARDADAISTFTITGGPDSKTGINYNFGELIPARLGNLVFLDDNGNGRQDGGAEVGINGVSVSLSGTDDTGRAVSLSTSTAGGGLYQFENLRPGSYTVTFANTDGTITYTRTVRDATATGTTDANDSDGDPATGTTGAYTIASGDDNQTVDQGLYVPVALGDRVYFDFDADGVQDVGEPGIPGASIEVVWLGPDGAIGGGDDVTYTTVTTGADGIWTVSNLPPGSFRVTSTLPAAYTLTDSLDNGGAASATNPVTVSTTSGVDRDDVDFGYRGNASLGDRVYIDQDGDGIQDAGEVGLPGVTVTLRFDANNDGDFTDAEDGLFTTVTGANGAYLFPNLVPGDYQISVPSGGTGGVPDNAVLTDSLDNGALNASATVTTNLVAGENELTVDFGFRGNASVGDRVWIDQDRDGIQDASEPGIPGATVQLRWAGQDGALDTADDVLFTTVTGTNGVYLFDGLLVYGPTDDFRATVTALPITGLTPTADLDSPAPNGDGTAEFVVSGTEGDPLNDRRDVDFGYDGLGSLAGTVYHDLNNDGIIQGNEPRISGVLLTLTGVDQFGNPVLDPATGLPYTATTDANGNYTFNTVLPGTYTITEAQPANYNDGIDTSGTLGGNPAVNDRVSGIVVGPSEDGTQYNFGERGTFLSGTVYRDDNRDGALQTGEPRIAGVTLQLFAADGTTPILNPATGAPYTATTDATGFYIFDDLLPGSYVVRETQPNGFADSPAGPGVTISATVPLAGLPNQNFGEVLGSLSGFVYVDANNNGSRDTGEAGIAGASVALTGTDANGNPVNRTATTLADGSYRFDNLLSGTYTVSEAQPAPFLDGQETVGSVGGSAAINDTISGAVLPAGANATDYNFGEIRPANPFLSGTVYLDANRDAVLQTGETGIAGVTVQLLDPGADGVFGTGDDTTTATTTDANGNYNFPNLTAGRQYQLIETQPAIYGSSTPNSVAVAPLPAAGLTNQNFGETLGRIAGSVYFDANTSGTRNAGEAGIAGVTVTLTGTDANGNPVNRTTTTDANGDYSFDALPAGTYTVTETQPAGYVDGLEALGTAGGSVANDVFSAIPLSGGASATNYDFGELGVPVSGTVFLDRDRDGTLDAGEPGIPGVTVQLLDANGTVVRTTTTDANGNYSFPNVPPGNYTIRELQPTGYGNPPAGTFAPDTRPITVAGVAVTNQNFGDTLSTLAGTVFVDANNDGVQQGGEAGIPNTPVALDSAGADNVFGTADDVLNFRTTSTNANGDYLFTDLFSGVYRVRETQPAPYTDGIDTPGSAGGDASTNDQITAIPVGAGTDLTEYNFGEVQPANPFISGNVYVDLDNDGTRDANEPPISGVSVTLTGPGGPLTTTTDANGNYTFTNLTTGANYTITEGQPTGYASGLENTANTTTVNNLPATGSTNNNFGELLGSLSGTVFFDRDASGALDGADVLLPGVTVTLSGTDANGGTVNRTTTTDANGNYLFDQLLAGNYTVTETQPAQFNQGTNAPGAFGTLGGTDQITVALPAGGASPANNFGELGAPISGRVYLDPNRDGVRQPGETTGLGGITITLFDANGTVVATTTTASDGTYSFTNLPPGNYTLVQTQPNTHLSTSANVIPVTLTAAGVVNQDFGEDLGSISGSVFRDVNNNGFREAGETGISNVTVTLTGTDVNGNPISRTTTTDANGNYTFLGLPAGTYQIDETQPVAFQDGQERVGTAGGNATTNDRFSAVALTAGTNATDYTFGEVTSSLSGFVYRDFNLDGTRNLTGANPDTGIAGITVTLTGTDDDGRAVNRTATTGADGSYRFEGLGSGAYTITETQPPLPTTLDNGFYDGADNLGSLNGTNGTKNQFAVALGLAENGTDYNFGELPPADPFGFVYADLNRNGLRDAGEPGISGVAITISGTAFAGTIFARPITGADVPGGSLTVFTDANGRWEFNPIPPGLYSVSEVQPNGYADGLESDGDPNGPPATVGNDVFTNILLNPFPIRGPFNFGEIVPEVVVPTVTPPLTTDQINKSMFLSSTPGQAMNMPVGPQFTNSVARLGVQSPARSIGVAVGSGAGVGAQAQLYDFRTGALRVSFSFAPFTGGVRAAAGDVTGDGIDDLVVSFGAGADPIVAVFDGATGQLTRAFLAFPNFYKGGVNVAVGDLNRDGFAEIVVSPEAGVQSVVRVFDGATGADTATFLALPAEYTGGVRLAVGDVNGDGFGDVVAATASLFGFVTAFSGANLNDRIAAYQAFGVNVPGANVAVGDTDGDGIAEILTAVGAGANSFVETRQLAGAGARTTVQAMGVPAPLGAGMRIATADINGDSAADLILSTTDNTRVRVVSGRTGNLLDDFFAFDPFMPTGVFVG